MPHTLKATHSIEIKELLRLADRKIQTKKGSYLFKEEMKANEIYLILSGKIQISKIDVDGKELSLRICGVNDIVGELTLFTSSPTYLLNALILEEGEVAAINRKVLEQEFFHNSALAFEFMRWMSDHFRKTQTKFRDLLLKGKKGALYSTLIRMTNSYGVKTKDGILINLPLTNQELANFCGTSRESANRLLNDLRRKKVITIYKGKITIHNLQFLKDEIDCENCPAIYCSID